MSATKSFSGIKSLIEVTSCRKIGHVFLILIGYFVISFSVSAAVPAAVQAVFVDNGCLQCHDNVTQRGQLSLADAAISEAELVDVNAACNANMKRVIPGDPSNSVLYRKISMQNPGCGGVMPQSGILISAADQATIFDWIVSIGPAAQFGMIEMAVASVSVQETDPTLTLTVNRLQGTEGSVTVDYVVSSVGADTAMSPEDYVAATGSVVFANGENTKTFDVVLADDDIFEGAEVFSATLSNAAGGAVLGSQTQTKITILDNEISNEPGTFLFGAVNYTVNESEPVLNVTILRSFGAAGAVTVELSSTDNTAINGMDYTAVNQTVMFAEGVKSNVITIALIDDQEVESNETFSLRLSNAAGGAVLGNPQNITVTLVDNDSTDGGETDGDTDTGDGTGTDEELPQEDASFVAAGTVSWWLLLLLVMILVVKPLKQHIKRYK